MSEWDITYYIFDAQPARSGTGGVNHLTTIDRKFIETDTYEATDRLSITETVMYGSDRLGTRNWNTDEGYLAQQAFTHIGANEFGEYEDLTPDGDLELNDAPTDLHNSYEGAKHYELKNHLGNVLATVSDKRDVEVNGSFEVESYTAKVSDVAFYYPFGSLMPIPDVTDFANGHRFGFNGQEDVYEVKNTRSAHKTALFWEYDTRLARRWNLDPIPQVGISDYATFTNNPILYSDVLGNTIDGKNEADAQEAKKEIGNSLNNPAGLDKFIQLRDDGKTFEKIDKKEFNRWLYGKREYKGKGSGLNSDQIAIANGWAQTINAEYKLTIEFNNELPGGQVTADGVMAANVRIGTPRSVGGVDRKLHPMSRTSLFVHEVLGEGRVWGNTRNFNNITTAEKGNKSMYGKAVLEIIQTENLYNRNWKNGFVRSGVGKGDHDVHPDDEKRVSDIPESLKSTFL
jgi:hypothetical protein